MTSARARTISTNAVPYMIGSQRHNGHVATWKIYREQDGQFSYGAYCPTREFEGGPVDTWQDAKQRIEAFLA